MIFKKYLINKIRHYFSFYSYSDHTVYGNIPRLDGDLISLSPKNMPATQRYGLNLLIPFSPTKWWTVNTQFNFTMREESFSYLEERIHNQFLGSRFSASNTFGLPKGFKVELSAWYNSPYIEYVYKYEDQFDLSIGLNKSIFAGKGNFSFRVTDLFNRNISRSLITIENLEGERYSPWNTRSVQLSFSYQIGKKTVETVEGSNGSNQEERSRL